MYIKLVRILSEWHRVDKYKNESVKLGSKFLKKIHRPGVIYVSQSTNNTCQCSHLQHVLLPVSYFTLFSPSIILPFDEKINKFYNWGYETIIKNFKKLLFAFWVIVFSDLLEKTVLKYLLSRICYLTMK